MKSMIEQLRSLPTANLCLYLLGIFAIMVSMAYMHGLKPAFYSTKNLQVEHQQLSRLSTQFDLEALQLKLAQTKAMQRTARDSMLKDIPNRALESELPTILESLHHAAKSYGLRTQKIQPSEIDQGSEIATVSLEIQVVGAYRNLYTWIQDFNKNFEGVSVSDIRATQGPGSNGNRTLAMNMVIYGR